MEGVIIEGSDSEDSAVPVQSKTKKVQEPLPGFSAAAPVVWPMF